MQNHVGEDNSNGMESAAVGEEDRMEWNQSMLGSGLRWPRKEELNRPMIAVMCFLSLFLNALPLIGPFFHWVGGVNYRSACMIVK